MGSGESARYVEVVTRYGGFRHLAASDILSRATGRLFTACRSTSAWTIESWEAVPDHPSLTPEQMRTLPPCERCAEATGRAVPTRPAPVPRRDEGDVERLAGVLAESLPSILGWDWEEEQNVPSVSDVVADVAANLARELITSPWLTDLLAATRAEALREAGVLGEVAAERQRQDAKWGEQNHPNGTGGGGTREQMVYARNRCDERARAGTVTWADILREEHCEALAEPDPAALRAELIQVAAVAVAWVEKIDRDTAADGAR